MNRTLDLWTMVVMYYDEIQAQWYEDSYWRDIRQSVEPLDALIAEFNRMSGATVG